MVRMRLKASPLCSVARPICITLYLRVSLAGFSAGTLGSHVVNGAAPAALDFQVYHLAFSQHAATMAATYRVFHLILPFGLHPDTTVPV